jgi:hypothetical protein
MPQHFLCTPAQCVDENSAAHAAASSPVTAASNFFLLATHRRPIRLAGSRSLSSKWKTARGDLPITLAIAAAPHSKSED